MSNIQQCKNCNKHFSWKKVYLSFWGWGYKSIICEKCGTEHRITFSGRLIATFLIVLPMSLFMNFLTPFENFFTTIFNGILLAFFGSILTPFLVRFKSN
ncbi:hypothetical protein FS935_01260 [Metabacillus litoralis]|uniref:Cxxc_20_cxxc protein n=1 Tax=Metabacillus litoralis TaxID=152268 RepID=A0A5C6W7E0_9BACI|nr:hypothetical protein FS935_01260 [Metabacillus litoralis]